jgi:hypothetical protein
MPETFAGLEVDERRENGRYVYSFRGTPRISQTIDSSKQKLLYQLRKSPVPYMGRRAIGGKHQERISKALSGILQRGV